MLFGLCFLISESSASAKNFDNLMSTGAISGLLGNSYVYTFSKSDFKSVAFNTTDFAVKSFLGNLFIIASGKKFRILNYRIVGKTIRPIL